MRNRYTRLLIIGLVLLSVGGVVFRLLTPPQLPTSITSWNNIYPGRSTQNEVIGKLGQPLQISTTPQGELYAYKSAYDPFPHEIVFDNEKKVKIEKIRLNQDETNPFSQTITRLQQPDFIVYTTIGDVFPLEVYLKEGIAVARATDSTANKEIVFEVWLFAPTTREDFLNLAGEGIRLEPDTGGERPEGINEEFESNE